MNHTFLEYFQRDEEAARKNLRLLKKVFEDDGMYAMDFTGGDEKEPYLYVMAPSNLSFQGIRFYQKGDILAFRVQKEPKTVPYGKPYEMNLQHMLDDIMLDISDKELAVDKLCEFICRKVKDFFKQTSHAEKRILDAEISDNGVNGFGQITIRNADNEPLNPKASNQDPIISKTGGNPYSTTFNSGFGNN